MSGNQQETSLQQYSRFMAQGDERSPVERLRFFLSLALAGQDWIDVEPFIDDITTALSAAEQRSVTAATVAEGVVRDAARYGYLRNSTEGIEFRDGDGAWRADCLQGPELDAAIDAALASGEPK